MAGFLQSIFLYIYKVDLLSLNHKGTQKKRVMISLAHGGGSIWRRNYAVLFLVGVTLIVWGMLILSFVIVYKGIF